MAAAAVILLLAGLLVWRSAGRNAEPEPTPTPEPTPEPTQEITIPIPAGMTAEDLEKIWDIVIVGDTLEWRTEEQMLRGSDGSLDRNEVAYDSWDGERQHYYSTEDGHEFEAAAWDLDFLRYLPNLRSLTMVLVDADALPDLGALSHLERVDLSDCSLRDISGLKGSAVTLSNLFDCLKYFKTGKVQMYGELKDVRYFTCVLLWGQKRYKPLRFVLVECEGRQSILVSTDVSLDAITIIKLYATRFSIEETFREFKQQIGGFCYHFWTKAISKLNHFAKKSDPDPLESVLSKPDRDKVLNTIKAIEGYVLFASISMGILQLLALNETPSGDVQKCRYLRTLPKERPSEATVMYYFHRRFYPVLMKTPSSFVTRLILEKMAG